MGWFKRNLMFAIGGLVAVLLLLAAAFYDWRSWDHNATSFGRLNEIYGKLGELNGKKYLPGNEKVDNIKAAKEQDAQVQEWIGTAEQLFKPITPIPDEPEVTSEAFAAGLRRTIDQLQHQAEDANVLLPPKYGFSFEAQRMIVRFAPGSLNPLAVQLGEVKDISEILFAAGINTLDGIQRVRVSDDDTTGPQADYLGEVSVTNNLAVLTPYVVTFRSFSPELAKVLAGFAASPNGMIVKAINIAPAGAATQPTGGPSPYYQQNAPGMYPPNSPGMYPQNGPGGYQPNAPGMYPPNGMGGPMPPPSATGSGRGGPPTVLNEQLLRITLEVVIVKPLPNK